MAMATSPSTTLSFAEEIAIVAQIRAGDQSACTRFVKLFSSQMMATARRFMRNDEDCDDAVQDALISVFNAINRFKADSALASWVHRITVNCCLMKLRAYASRKESSIEDVLGKLEEGCQELRWCTVIHNPAEKVQTDEMRAVVRKAIDELPEVYRKVLWLRYIEETNTAATAALLKTTANNVKSRMRRARRALLCRLQALMTGEMAVTFSMRPRARKALALESRHLAA
jgi:RNA polymerase sigma-70 factor, ECF subfamily